MAEVLPAPTLTAPGPALAPRSRLRLAGRYAALILAAAVVLVPIYCALVVSLQPASKLLDFPGILLPTSPTFSTFSTAFRAGSLGRYLLNSAGVSLAITAAQVVTSILAAYAFAYLRFPAKRLVFAVFLATLMVPTEVTIVANYETVADLGWLDSYQGLVVPFLAFAFGTFLVRQAFLGVPQDLRDAAALDGYGHVGFLWHVAVPLARPAIAALAVFSFLSAWNQYLWPLLITNQDRYRTVQIGLRQLASANVDELNLVMAGTVIAALPIFVVLVVFQRHLIRGLTSGALKG
ncbi:MAG TPA: carbohydrate ABC transporter permease [Acidimicrobiales bacterium]|jgi:sn-glycerol 3-phosphate transport system permease protein